MRDEAGGPPSLPGVPAVARGSGAVLEPPLLDPLLLGPGPRQALESHVRRKRLQLLWGLPAPVRSSLQSRAPVLPASPPCAAPQEDPRGPPDPARALFRAERRRSLERHLREKLVHRKWGLPRGVQAALRLREKDQAKGEGRRAPAAEGGGGGGPDGEQEAGARGQPPLQRGGGGGGGAGPVRRGPGAKGEPPRSPAAPRRPRAPSKKQEAPQEDEEPSAGASRQDRAPGPPRPASSTASKPAPAKAERSQGRARPPPERERAPRGPSAASPSCRGPPPPKPPPPPLSRRWADSGGEDPRAAPLLPGEDQRRYFELHLREKLLHQRWGPPRRVRESLARCCPAAGRPRSPAAQ